MKKNQSKWKTISEAKKEKKNERQISVEIFSKSN